MHINLFTFPVLSINTTHCTLCCIFDTSQGAKIKVARVYRAFYLTELPVYTQAYLSNLGYKLETHFFQACHVQIGRATHYHAF